MDAPTQRAQYRPSPLSLRSQSAGSDAGPLPTVAEAGAAVPPSGEVARPTVVDDSQGETRKHEGLLVRALRRCVFDDPDAADRFKEKLAEFGQVESCELLPEFSAARVQ